MSDKIDRETEDDASLTRAREAPLIGSRTLHRHTKDVLDRVERGESVVILRYGQPTAALVPISEEQAQAMVFAGSPELMSDSDAAPDAAAEATAEPFAVASADVESDEPSELLEFDIELSGTPLTQVVTTDLAILADTQRQIRSGVSDVLARLDQQARALAALARGQEAAGADTSQQSGAGDDVGIT
jgi:prevent-host-death family protein